VNRLSRILATLGVILIPAATSAQGSGAAVQTGVPAILQAALSDSRLAYFSPQRAFSQSAAGQAAQALLTALQTERAREIDARSKTLRTQQQQLEQSTSFLTENARGQRAKELEKFEVDLQRFIQDAQAELTGFQRDVESEFLAKIRPALEQVVKDKSLWLVFNEDAGLIAWVNPALDITGEVVTRIDQP
jgi:outer membrane protein